MNRQLLIVLTLSFLVIGTVLASIGYIETTKKTSTDGTPSVTTITNRGAIQPADGTEPAGVTEPSKVQPQGQVTPSQSGTGTSSGGTSPQGQQEITVHKRLYDPVTLNLVCDKQDFFTISLAKQSKVISVQFTVINGK